MFQGVIHGRTIELQEEPGLPDGQAVAVTIQRIEPSSAAARPDHIPQVESWVGRLIFDRAVHPTERIVKGTPLVVSGDRGLSFLLDTDNAATALTYGLTLVTHNTQDYQHVPSLSLADWLVP
jgi:hypothetical protein